MVLKLYMKDTSPPVRAVLLTAKALGLSLELVTINILKGEQFTAEFLKINPQHTIPTLDDNGKVIWDSHAINIYLVSTYGKNNNSLYPEDPYTRAVISQRLHYDSGVLFPTALKIIMPLALKQSNTILPENAKSANDGYQFLEKFLEGQNWMAGNDVTLADLSLITTVTSLDVMVPIHEEEFPNITAWIKRVQRLPYYDDNTNGLKHFKDLILEAMNS